MRDAISWQYESAGFWKRDRNEIPAPDRLCGVWLPATTDVPAHLSTGRVSAHPLHPLAFQKLVLRHSGFDCDLGGWRSSVCHLSISDDWLADDCCRNARSGLLRKGPACSIEKAPCYDRTRQSNLLA